MPQQVNCLGTAYFGRDMPYPDLRGITIAHVTLPGIHGEFNRFRFGLWREGATNRIFLDIAGHDLPCVFPNGVSRQMLELTASKNAHVIVPFVVKSGKQPKLFEYLIFQVLTKS